MHLSAPRNRYIHTIASKGKMLENTKQTRIRYYRLFRQSGGISNSSFGITHTHLFIKLTMYTMRGVQIMGWSVRMALMDCFTQNSGLNGGRNGSISFLTRPGERKEGREGENMMIKSRLCLIKSAQSAPPVRASHYWVETDPACTFYSSGSPYCAHENPSWQWHERPQAKLPWLLLSNVYSN